MFYFPFLSVFAVFDLWKYRDALREVNEFGVFPWFVITDKVIPFGWKFSYFAPCE